MLTATTDDPLDDDYGLIDFGTNTAVPTMYGMPVVGMARINERNAICHDGIRTGIACGQLGDRYIGPQYLTTGMPNSIPGDSGGPVWQISARGAVVVGIWLGEHIDDASRNPLRPLHRPRRRSRPDRQNLHRRLTPAPAAPAGRR